MSDIEELKPDAAGFAYVLRWMDFLHGEKSGADASFVLEWRDFTRQAADALSALQRENAELRQKLEEARKDAENFRWIAEAPAGTVRMDGRWRQDLIGFVVPSYVHWGEFPDKGRVTLAEAIDAARQ